MHLFNRWQNNAGRVPETAVNSTAGILWLCRNFLTSLFERPPGRRGCGVSCTTGRSFKLSLFGCLLVNAPAAAIYPRGDV